MSTDMRHSLSLQVGNSFCIANVQLQYRTLHTMILFSPSGILGILVKSRISEEFLVENFGPPSTFQEFTSWTHPWQKIFQGTFAKEKMIVFYDILKKRKIICFFYAIDHIPQ